MREYPPAYVSQEADCPDAPTDLIAFRVDIVPQAFPDTPRVHPHQPRHRQREPAGCGRARPIQRPPVLAVNRPAGAVRPLYVDCSGTDGDTMPLSEFLGFSQQGTAR